MLFSQCDSFIFLVFLVGVTKTNEKKMMNCVHLKRWLWNNKYLVAEKQNVHSFIHRFIIFFARMSKKIKSFECISHSFTHYKCETVYEFLKFIDLFDILLSISNVCVSVLSMIVTCFNSKIFNNNSQQPTEQELTKLIENNWYANFEFRWMVAHWCRNW